ncbi:MAG: hypothetical protein A2167_07940 [Planctomycetes bacterium RBG_13_46_10]|nr:MAG: hypothetical protein A2167_07940 [Planctomycetes bacterium RBG_13_46_10]
MKIKVEREKIVKALKEVEGLEVAVENVDDAKEALDLILKKSQLFKGAEGKKVKDIIVTATQEYKTSAVEYNLVFTLEFVFASGVFTDTKIALIKEVQDFFGKY